MKKLISLVLLLGFSMILHAQEDQPYCEMCWASALISEDNSSCSVEWSSKWREKYDDGTVENFIAFVLPGGMTAVRYPTYGVTSPLRVFGGEINVGDGSFPVGSDFLGQTFRAIIFDDDGPDGMPGTILDSTTVTVNNYHWVRFEGLNVVITEGYFYLAIEQLSEAPDIPPVGVDSDYQSFPTSFFTDIEGEWQSYEGGDLIIRQLSCGMKGEVKITNSEKRDHYGTFLYLVKDFDPTHGEGPEDGIMVLIDSNLWVNTYEYTEWNTLPEGYYAFAVKEYCQYGGESGLVYTNILQRNIDYEIEFKDDEMINVHPNPFSSIVTISYEMSQSATVQITIFNHLGKQVDFIQQNQSSGKQQITWDASNQPSGVYYFRMQVGEQAIIGKMVKL